MGRTTLEHLAGLRSLATFTAGGGRRWRPSEEQVRQAEDSPGACGMTVLVTGGAGYIGSHTVRALRAPRP